MLLSADMMNIFISEPD